MARWMPLVGGMAAFVLATLLLILWLVFGGSTGKQRGLVVINLRASDAVLTFDDGQTQRIGPGNAETLFAIKKDFPQTMHVSDGDGRPLFEQLVAYQELVDAEFRIAIGEDRIVFPVKPPGS